MFLADTLSRAYLPTTARSPAEEETERIHAVDYLPISELQLAEIQRETAADSVLQSLIQVILQGWPDQKDALPSELHPYLTVRDELTAQGGILFKGLRAPDCKYQKSYDRREISDFILFHLNVPFGELFSKNTIKSPATLSFFLKLEKLNLRQNARLSPLGKWEKSCIFTELAFCNGNSSRYSTAAASKSFYYLSLSVKLK